MGTVQTGADESHFQFNCGCKMQMTRSCDSLYECCWFPALLSGQEPHDPHQTSKSSQWLASYWVHYSKSTAVIWIDRLSFDSRRDVPKLCVCGSRWRCPHIPIPFFSVLSVPLLPHNLLLPTHISPLSPHSSYLSFLSCPALPLLFTSLGAVHTDKTFVSLSGELFFLLAYFPLYEMAQFHIEIEMCNFIFTGT